jgi:group I intron endonuclease
MFVYKISNSVNDRLYVGLTVCSLDKRWREHKSAANTGVDKPLYRAMRKHGVENFKISLLYIATSIEDMREAELRFIKELKAHANDGGYNLTDHGYQHGKANQLSGEQTYNASLTEEVVAFIRDPAHWDKSNATLLKLLEEKFGFNGARDTVRDARRGDSWKHLNDKYPPIKSTRGSRQAPRTEEQKQKARETMLANAEYLHRRKIESRAGKRAPNATIPEETVKAIFYSPLSLLKTAEQYGVSKKMVMLIKQRKAHVYLTKDL